VLRATLPGFPGHFRSPKCPLLGKNTVFQPALPIPLTSVGESATQCLGFLLFGLESSADPEHVAIRMAKVHLADVPRHIAGRKCDFQPGSDALLVHLVHVVHPDRHPDTLVTLFVSVLLKRGGVRAPAATSLRPLTKKDASFFARSNRAKRRRRSPLPQFLPSPLLKPRDRAGDVGHVQDRSQTLRFHNESRITPEFRGFGRPLKNRDYTPYKKALPFALG
jgi:hypothetical protein